MRTAGFVSRFAGLVLLVGLLGAQAFAGQALGAAQADYRTVRVFGGNPISGEQPQYNLIQGSDGALYGTTTYAGQYGYGTVFRVQPDGSGMTILHHFTGIDGQNPYAGLTQASDGMLYGTTYQGGSAGVGTVFKITTGGTYSQLYSFHSTGGDGQNPEAGLVQASDGALYGTTYQGGSAGYGTVFKITTGGAYSILYNFSGGDGQNPKADLVQASDGALYGTTDTGGSAGVGTIFKITTGGMYTQLYSFLSTGGDGRYPSGLVQSIDGALYGTTRTGGSASRGTVFKITTGGTCSVLYSFKSTGGDGQFPQAGLVQASDGALYGTTNSGGSANAGTVFKIATGDTYSVLYSFQSTGGDGWKPYAGLAQASDGALYGTTYQGGSAGVGTVFKITTGGEYRVLCSFQSSGDGQNPQAGLVQASDGAFYGTTVNGGSGGYGTVFKITTGGAYSRLYSFQSTGGDGWKPYAGLVQASDGALYGTTYQGGSAGKGTVFKITTGGTYTRLYSFLSSGGDGQNPQAGLVQASDGALYGTTRNGGSAGAGTVFKITMGGTYSVLYSFQSTGGDGQNPYAGLVPASDGVLYGTTYAGGSANVGTIFKITTGGTYTRLYSFQSSGGDGQKPYAGLVQASDGALYGTTRNGGSAGYGTVFKITTGGAYSVLYSFQFSSGRDGYNTLTGLVQARDGALYGTTNQGGSAGNGTVYKITTGSTYRILYSFKSTGGDGQFPYAGLVQAGDGVLYGTTGSDGGRGYGTVFAIVPPPMIQSVSPNTGDVAGGNVVTLTGSNFLGATTVSFGGSAVSATLASSTQLTCLAPARAAGTVDITVTTSAGSDTATGVYTFIVPPVTLAIAAPLQTLTRSGPVTFTVMYTNAATVTLSANDIALNAVGSATGTVAVDGSGTDVRTITLSNITGDGKLGIIVAPGTALNAAGTPAAGASSAQFDVDNNPPSVQSIALLTPSPTRDATAVWRVTFSEPLRANTTAFVLTRVSGTVVGYTVSSVNASYGSVIDVTVKTGVGTGDLRLDVPAGIFKDAAGNAAPAFMTGDICTVDRIAPQAATTIVAPIGSSAASSPEFQWTPVDRATEYALRLQDITTTVTTVYNTTIPHAGPWWQTGTNNRWASNLGLTDKHLYMAQITPSNEFGGAPISAAVIFGIGSAPTQAPQSAPTITQPSGNNVPLNNVDMLWTALPDASSYGVYVADTTTNTVIVNAPVTSTSYRLPALQTSHSYAAYVRGINYFGCGPWSAIQAFACNAVTTPPATPPTLTSPTANTLYPPTPATVHFEWANITNATTYSLLIINVTTNTNAFNGSVAAISGATTYTDIALSAGCNYKAYVKAGNAFGWTAYSSGVLFGTTGGATALPLAPSITKPANNGSVSYQSVQFQWSAQPGDSFYNVLIYNVTNNWALQVNQTPTTNTATYTLSPLCRYLVYVRANNAYGPGPYAAEYFTTLATAPQIIAPAITSSTSATGTVGQSFSYTVTASGTAPITYTVMGLASGLTFDGASTISGVLTDSGTATITLKATNAAGSDTKKLTITVGAAASREAPMKPAPSGQF